MAPASPSPSTAFLAGLAPALPLWFWDELENASGRDGPSGLALPLGLFAAGWAVAFFVIHRLAARPRRAGWLAGGFVAVVGLLVLARVAVGLDEGGAVAGLVFLLGAPVVIVALGLGVTAGVLSDWLRARRPRPQGP